VAGSDSAQLESYWTLGAHAVLAQLASGSAGLSSTDASARLRTYGPNELADGHDLSRARVLWNQLRSPLLGILIFAAVVSGLTGEWLDSGLVLAILAASAGLGYSREYRAQSEAAKLRSRLQTRATVLRNDRSERVALREIVPGDIVLLSAGTLVPADAVLLDATDLFVNEAVLTGESYPTEKSVRTVPATSTLRERTNCVFLGTHVRTGSARAVVVRTGQRTEFGRIAHRLALRAPETEFDRGLRQFGSLLTTAMLVVVLLVFAVNTIFGRPPVETLLFSIALAVGLSPELLPVILSINLARGARSMSRHGVLVRRLAAIENLGSMDVLCTDKTGTLTEGIVRLEGAYDPDGEISEQVLRLAAWNAALQTGFTNPLDEAILEAHDPDRAAIQKLGEVPYDFARKRLSVVLREGAEICLVTKGAFHAVLDACSRVAGGRALDPEQRARLVEHFRAWSEKGVRVIAVATRSLPEAATYGRDVEHDLVFAGFLTFLDRPKAGARKAIQELQQLGVAIKLITGDTRLVAQHIAAAVGLATDRVLAGRELLLLGDEALWHAVERTDLFVEVDPNQKERIIRALRTTGHVVGFLGDGVNDAPAMHAADTSLSVMEAADVAREAADFVLLERHLDVIRRGIEEGRRTFANTLKYVLTTTSANLGNMLSMAVASLVLPFLPLLAGQVLLNNFLSDIPAIGLADDRVDPELVDRPRRWDLRSIGRFMLVFGSLSSLFDLLTFALLLVVFAAPVAVFRTGWFVESLLTELVVALLVRTSRPFWRSRPGRLLLVSTLVLVPLTLAIPFLPFAGWFGFAPVPGPMLAAIVALTLLYAAATELAKSRFQRV
jgi:P-type Mg2+ transporter